jgi:hypothetical protein
VPLRNGAIVVRGAHVDHEDVRAIDSTDVT